jgi:HK97 family phage prohead protease
MSLKFLDVQIEKAAASQYDASFVMSAITPDRVKDTIELDAYTPNIGKRLVALWQHNSDQPFGVWENLRVKSGRLIGDLKASGTNLGQMVRQLIADDVPLGASIGFRGKGSPNKQGGIHFDEVDLLECSIVSVPAHPRAVQIAKSFGIDLPSTEVNSPAMSGDYLVTRKRAALAIIAANRLIKGHAP